MCLTAVVYNCKSNASWSKDQLNEVLIQGNVLYSHISRSVGKDRLLLSEIPSALSINDENFSINFSGSFAGDLHMSSVRDCYLPLQCVLQMLIKDYDAFLLTVEINTVAIIIDNKGHYRIFDSHSRDIHGNVAANGTAVLLEFSSMEEMVQYLQNFYREMNVVPFEVLGIKVENLRCTSSNTLHVPFTTADNRYTVGCKELCSQSQCHLEKLDIENCSEENVVNNSRKRKQAQSKEHKKSLFILSEKKIAGKGAETEGERVSLSQKHCEKNEKRIAIETKAEEENMLKKSKEQKITKKEIESREQRENRLKKHRDLMRKRRKAETDQQRENRVRKCREQRMNKKEIESKEQRENRLKKPREQRQEKETKQQRETRIRKCREQRINKKKIESKEQRENRLKKRREVMRKRQGTETEQKKENRIRKCREQRINKEIESKEQRENRLRKYRELMRKRQETETEQQRENRLKERRERYRKNKETESKEKREERLKKQRESRQRVKETKNKQQKKEQLNQEGHLKQTSCDELVVSFRELVATGPTFVCACCDQLWYKHSLVRTETVHKLNNESVQRCIRTNEQCCTAQWVCRTCYNHLKQNKVPPCAVQNKMSFPHKPDHLDLTELEWRLVSPRLIFQKIHEAARGKQFKIRGNIVNVPADVINTVNFLPRLSTETDTIKVQLKRKLKYKNYVLSQNIRPLKVFEAAKWLTENGTLYKKESIKLNPDWNGLLTGFDESDKSNDSGCSSSSNITDINTPVASIKSLNTTCSAWEKEQSLFSEHMAIVHDLPPMEDDSSQFSEVAGNVSSSSVVRLFRYKILDPENVVLVEMCSKGYGLANTISLKALVGVPVTLNESRCPSSGTDVHFSSGDLSKDYCPTEREIEDPWNEIDESEIYTGTLDTMLTSPDFVEDCEREKVLNFAPGESNHPISIFKDQYCEELAYPGIFCGQAQIIRKGMYLCIIVTFANQS
ncbi:hypothetical protein ACROYT_G000850 [Oculina patagonica]